MFARRLPLSIVFLATALCAGARADVIVVDPQGGPGEAVLLAALQSADEGDILLLEAGDYSSGLDHFIFFDFSKTKGVTIVADAGAGPVVLRGLDLHLATGLDSFGGTTLLRGIEIRSPADQNPYPAQGSLYVYFGYSPVGVGGLWVEDCKLLGRDGFVGPAGNHSPAAAALVTKGQVVFTHCELHGGSGASDFPNATPDATSGSPAVSIQGNSNVTLADCVVHGGRAGDGIGYTVPNGGDAVTIPLPEDKVATLWISGSQLTGGDDGANGSALAHPGRGLFANPLVPENRVCVRDSTILAGQLVGEGVPAPDISVPASCLQTFPVAARSCSLPAPVRSDEPATLSIKGRPGDAVLLIASPGSMSFKLKPALQAAINFAAWDSYAVPPFVIADPSGTLDVPFTLPRLPDEFGGGVTLFMQGVFAGSDGLTLGAPTSLVWLDAGV